MHQKLSTYLKNKYGEKIYRLSLSSGCTCPNRDGSILMPDGTPLTGGCTFCSEGGSGDFAAQVTAGSIDQQIQDAKELISKKTDARHFIAYFQSFSNTYGDISRLKELYTKVINREDIVILSLGTRPDCIDDSVLAMLKELNQIKPVWIELGLQTINEESARRFHRGYELKVFEKAYKALKDAGITVVVHVILGLPYETKEDMLKTVKYLAALDPALDGIKLQNLQILKGTAMYQDYLNWKERARSKQDTVVAGKTSGEFYFMDMEEYTDLIAECIALLPETTVIHRMTGDGPRKLLVEPLWTLDKKRVLNTLTRKCRDLLE